MMRLSVCLRGSALFIFKEIDEMVGTVIADSQCDLMDLIVSGEKEVDCSLQSFFIQVS